MEYALFALPTHDGKTSDARTFLQDLERVRSVDYATSEQRLGITKEVWAIQQTPERFPDEADLSWISVNDQ